MSWTKRQLLEQSFAGLGMASWQNDLEPEDINFALNFMDSMVSSWGMNLGYLQSSTPKTSDPDQASGLPLDANLAVWSNVAIGIAPKFGKNPAVMLQRTAALSFDQLQSRVAIVIPMRFDKTLGVGAGNKPWRGIFRQFMSPEDGDTTRLNTELDIK